MNDDVPMIWTSRGHMPEASLRFEVEWQVTDDFIRFTERHFADDGEVVKQSSHLYDRVGVQARLLQSTFG